MPELKNLGVEVVGLSVDPEEDAKTLVNDIGIKFPLLYGLDCIEVAEKIGAFYDSEDKFFHATNFLLRNGKILQSTYSSGPIGRMTAEDVASLVEFYQS